MEINSYNSAIYEANRFNSSKTAKKDGSSLGMDDFLVLLAAQLANQDMMNPASDTEFIAQLAQFSSLQSMDSVAKMTMMNQSTSLVGKTVVVATYDKSNQLVTEEGVVDKVTIFGSTIKIVVNGKEYEYSNVMEIKNTTEKPTEPESPGEGETDTTK